MTWNLVSGYMRATAIIIVLEEGGIFGVVVFIHGDIGGFMDDDDP